MAEGRMLKKRISKSRKLAELKTDSARMLYFFIYPHLDIKGRFSGDSYIIKGHIVPYIKSWTTTKIETCLKDLARVKLILLYEVDGETFLECVRFADHQILRPEREAPSEIPDPPEGYETTVAIPRYGPGVEIPLEKKDIPKKDKIKLMEFVYMTREEHDKLCDKYTDKRVREYVERLNNYIGSSGKRYKSHYHTILQWIAKDGQKDTKTVVHVQHKVSGRSPSKEHPCIAEAFKEMAKEKKEKKEV